MDINEFFRGFFGFPRMRPPEFEDPFFQRHDEFFDRSHFDENESNIPIDQSDPSSDSFGFFNESDEFPSMFRQMEDMFSNMFHMHSGFLDFPNLEVVSEPSSPRDLMLKESDCKSCGTVLQDNGSGNRSSQISNISPDDDGGRNAAFDDRVIFQNPKPMSFHKSFTSKIVRTGDGVVEEHRTITDSSGKTVTTVTKSLGDKTYTVTTESDKTGMTEKKEDFINMDENDLSQFENDLKQMKNSHFGSARVRESVDTNEPRVQVLPPAPPGDPKYISIFKTLFGS